MCTYSKMPDIAFLQKQPNEQVNMVKKNVVIKM